MSPQRSPGVDACGPTRPRVGPSLGAREAGGPRQSPSLAARLPTAYLALTIRLPNVPYETWPDKASKAIYVYVFAAGGSPTECAAALDRHAPAPLGHELRAWADMQRAHAH